MNTSICYTVVTENLNKIPTTWKIVSISKTQAILTALELTGLKSKLIKCLCTPEWS